MRIKTATLTFNTLKHFREMRDLDYQAFQMVMEHAEIAAHLTGDKIADVSYSDPYAYFLLQGCVRLSSGRFKTHILSCEDKKASAMLNHLLPEGGIIAAEDGTAVLLIIKRCYIQAARLDYQRPLPITTNFSEADNNIQQNQSSPPGKDWMSTLLSSPLFSRVKPNHLQQLLLSLEERSFKAGETIISFGQKDEYFYIIKLGSVEILLKEQNSMPIKLGPGSFFGEGAITGNTVHSATVKMLEDGIICLVHMSQFDSLLKASLFEFANTEQLEQLLYSDSNPAIVLDVRFPREYRDGHRKNSINIPVNKLRKALKKELSKDIMYLVDNGEDKRSQVAALILIENGFTVLLIKDNLEASKHKEEKAKRYG